MKGTQTIELTYESMLEAIEEYLHGHLGPQVRIKAINWTAAQMYQDGKPVPTAKVSFAQVTGEEEDEELPQSSSKAEVTSLSPR